MTSGVFFNTEIKIFISNNRSLMSNLKKDSIESKDPNAKITKFFEGSLIYGFLSFKALMRIFSSAPRGISIL
jgi:hypothetical protein